MPGAAKTRLVPDIGALPAACLQRCMTEQTMRVVRAAAKRTGAEIDVRYTGCDERKIRRWLGDGVSFTTQHGGDLGSRMERAFATAFADGCGRVVLVGTDCPDISPADIADAFAALTDSDCVLGSSADGGYWLIGLRGPARLFDGVTWGGPTVMRETLSLAADAGLSVRTLRTLADVDTPADLRNSSLAWAQRAGEPYVSVIIPALNEADNIGAAVASARCDDAEIIVVDGGSCDGTAALAADAGARVICCSPGRAGQMNLGASVAAGEVLLFLHADTLLPSRYVELVFDALSDPRTAGGAFEHQTDCDGLGMSFLAMTVRFRANYTHLPYGDQGIFVRRSVFDEIGGFADVPIAEDLYFVRRMGAMGRVVVAPGVAVTSGRRWRDGGIFRTTAINYLIVIGCILGLPPALLVRMYRGSAVSRA